MRRIEQLAKEVMEGRNPVLSFGDTYAVRGILKAHGYFKTGELKRGFNFISTSTCVKHFQYRVNHGGGDVTQNTYYVGQSVPVMESIK